MSRSSCATAAFRIHKSDLAIRPIWHHKAGRIKAHILVCFIAYALWKTLRLTAPHFRRNPAAMKFVSGKRSTAGIARGLAG
jgi:transposase